MNEILSRFYEGTVIIKDSILHCKSCNGVVNEDWDFCIRCGTRLSIVGESRINNHLEDCYDKWHRRCNL